MKKWFLLILLMVFLGVGVSVAVLKFGVNYDWQRNNFLSGFVEETEMKKIDKGPGPLQKYALENLATYNFKPSQVVITDEITRSEKVVSWEMMYETTDREMSGQVNWPLAESGKPLPVENIKGMIVMIRGYVPAETYRTGDGTRSGAAFFAENGFVTVAPDFLGVAKSDLEPENTWESRFIKPVQVVELIKSVQKYPLKLDGEQVSEFGEENLAWQELPMGMWAHSNGGQIALATLMADQEALPTTLWAPVTAPFPYSILFFSDELADEGKETRKWLSLFEDEYDVWDFSLSQHLDLLPAGKMQLHHGSADEAALQVWSDEFLEKVDLENERRAEESADSSGSAQLEKIDLTYYKYPGADHNMRPVWSTVILRDLEFFEENLINKE
jgi:hypothetical protein